MTETFRRILWLIPVLSVGAVFLFITLASVSTMRPAPSTVLLYNANPESAEIAAQEALRDLAARKPGAEAELARLGGAALPTILPLLPSIPIFEQRRIVLALKPVAERMGLKQDAWQHDWKPTSVQAAGSASNEADTQLLFWERYRDEHGLDLRPLATSRLVRRLVQSDVDRKNADLLALDTYALPVLVASLGRVRDASDVGRIRRIAGAISHTTGEDFSLSSDANRKEAQVLATQIRRFWDDHGAKWTELDPLSLLVGRFSQTEFARWAFRTTRQISGLDDSEVARRLRAHGLISLPLFICSLGGFILLGPAIAAFLQILELRRTRVGLRSWSIKVILGLTLVSVLQMTLRDPSRNTIALSLLSLLAGSAVSAFTLDREIGDRLDWRTHHVLHLRRPIARTRAVVAWIAPSIPTLAPLAVAESALWISCLEVSAQSRGLGMESLLAVRTGDLDYLMGVCLGLGLATGMAQVLADLVLGQAQLRRGES